MATLHQRLLNCIPSSTPALRKSAVLEHIQRASDKELVSFLLLLPTTLQSDTHGDKKYDDNYHNDNDSQLSGGETPETGFDSENDDAGTTCSDCSTIAPTTTSGQLFITPPPSPQLRQLLHDNFVTQNSTIKAPSASHINCDSNSSGSLTLIGAGPGDPSLLTLAALRAIQSADLLILDRLLPPAFLTFITTHKPAHARVHTVRKPAPHKQDHSTTHSEYTVAQAQSELYTLLHTSLQQSLHIVRLKNGDVSLFARTLEELQPLLRLFFPSSSSQYPTKIKIPSLILIPGVSSALSAGWKAGVPLTHRGVANQVLISTGTLQSPTSTPNLPTFDPERTLVLLMAVFNLPQLVKGGMLKKGYPGCTPVLVVEKAACPGETIGMEEEEEGKTVRATLEDVVERVKEAGVKSHATIIIGK
ncbi:hypothetical protein HDV05_005909, partial [Chytridiales sp. JEL 0842]